MSGLALNEPYGKYGVGFRSEHTFDYSRSFVMTDSAISAGPDRFGHRPIQLCIWYPALKIAELKPMQYEDYFFLSASETGPVALSASLKAEILGNYLQQEPVNAFKLRMELGREMKAIKNAKPDLSQKFPMIIYGPSWSSTAFENALLCEYLASHGYVVVSSPSMGPDSREMPVSLKGIETQARDMEFSLHALRGFPNADQNKIALMGYSLGGLSNVIVWARNRMVDAWIGIDPSINEAYDLYKESSYEDYGGFSVPALFINSFGYMHSLPFFDDLVYSDAYVVNLPKLGHTDMASQFIKLYADGTDTHSKVQEKCYNLMAKFILGFLDGIFKERLDFEKMSQGVFDQKEIDTNLVQIHVKKGILLPGQLLEKYKNQNGKGIEKYMSALSASNDPREYPEEDLQQIIYSCIINNFKEATSELMNWYHKHYPKAFHDQVLKFVTHDDMVRMFAKIYEDNQSCNFEYQELNHTAQLLSMGESKQEAMEYFILNTKLYPDNYQAFFNLGIGYFRLNEFQPARDNFTKCLTLDPDDRFRSLAKEFIGKTQL